MTKDDIISTDPINDCHRWSDFELRAIHRFMDGYAKQQAIAFAIDYAKSKLMWIRELRQYPDPDSVVDDRMEERYSQFIEQQTKDK